METALFLVTEVIFRYLLPDPIMENKKAYFNTINEDMKVMIFKDVSCQTKPGDLRLVCKDWQQIMDGKKLSERAAETRYANIGPVWKHCIHAWYGVAGHEEFLRQFLACKFLYKPNMPRDEGIIEWKISDLRNPFADRFDLSVCGDAGKELAIMTGFRKKERWGHEGKIQLWVTPRFVMEKFKESSAKHFKPIMKTWDEKEAPVGIFYTNGYNHDDLEWYDHLTNKSLKFLSSENLYKNWYDSKCLLGEGSSVYWKFLDIAEYHKNPQKDPGSLSRWYFVMTDK